MAMPYLQQYPGNLSLINRTEDIVIFLGLKVFNYDNSSTCLYVFEVEFVSHFCKVQN